MLVIITKNNKYVNSIETERKRETETDRGRETERQRERQVFSGAISLEKVSNSLELSVSFDKSFQKSIILWYFLSATLEVLILFLCISIVKETIYQSFIYSQKRR